MYTIDRDVSWTVELVVARLVDSGVPAATCGPIALSEAVVGPAPWTSADAALAGETSGHRTPDG